MPFEGKAIFDAALDYFRKLPQDYVTTCGNPSKLDQAELWLFGNPLTARIVYLSFVVALNIEFICHLLKTA